MEPWATIAILVAWGVFAAVWIVGAFRTARTVKRSWGWDRFLIALAVVLGLLFLRGGSTRPGSGLGPRFLPDSWATFAVGALVLDAGMAFCIWARVHLGRYWSGMVTLKEGHQIVRSGPYGIVRHPIYTGLLTAVVGSAILVGRAGMLLVFAAMLLAFLLKIRAEETLLRGHFGAEYDEYARSVPRLVPGLW